MTTTQKQPLHNHNSAETAYTVNDYPYGFTLRCKKRYWIETKKGYGQRLCTQTTNPKRPEEYWNKPKKGTYSLVLGMYLDENNHVQSEALTTWLSGGEADKAIKEFRENHSPLGEYQEKAIKYIRASIEAAKVTTWKINAGEPTQTREEQQAIHNRALNYGYAKIEGKV